MRETLEMDLATFSKYIWDWAEKYKFIIDGDYVVVENADIDQFVKELESQFAEWKSIEKEEGNKL